MRDRATAHFPSALAASLLLSACTLGPQVSTDRHQFTGTVTQTDGALGLEMTSAEGMTCRGMAQAGAADMIISCDGGLTAELIGVRDPNYFAQAVPFRFNNGAIGTATLTGG